jgi:hypothetical protein
MLLQQQLCFTILQYAISRRAMAAEVTPDAASGRDGDHAFRNSAIDVGQGHPCTRGPSWDGSHAAKSSLGELAGTSNGSADVFSWKNFRLTLAVSRKEMGPRAGRP